MRQETFRDAAVAAKYKILAALAIVVVTKCEPCIRAYAKMAYQVGVTQEELLEFLNVAMTEGGCPGEQWALKAYEVYKHLLLPLAKKRYESRVKDKSCNHEDCACVWCRCGVAACP
jgi:AhpD family alkylhydroperoxidase